MSCFLGPNAIPADITFDKYDGADEYLATDRTKSFCISDIEILLVLDLTLKPMHLKDAPQALKTVHIFSEWV